MNPPDIVNPHDPVTEWIRSAAIPFDTVEPRHGWKDLEALRDIIGNARIVSLGETTHGTREFFKLKHRILEFCVAELGFTTFIMEAYYPQSLAVNDYVLHGMGNAADVLTGLGFWIWDSEEIFDLIEWMRWWNINNARKVKFFGFTVSADVGSQRLIEFLERVSPQLAAACRTEFAPLTSGFTAALFGQLQLARREAIFAFIAQIVETFDQQKHSWVATTSFADWHTGRLLAVTLDQGARFEIDRNADFHERITAENVCALLEAEGPDTRAVLWSHNAHAARTVYSDGSKSMGKYLDEFAGRSQVVVGFSFDRGSFKARSYPASILTDCSVTASAKDSFDSKLAEAGPSLFALDLAGASREGVISTWLSSPISARSIGGIYGFPADNAWGVTYTTEIKPREEFDAVVFVAETTASRQNWPSILGQKLISRNSPSNFELEGVGVPTMWQGVVTEHYPQHITGSPTLSPRGGRTVLLSRKAPWRWGETKLEQKISLQQIRSKRLKFSAALRAEVNEVGAGALLFLRFLAKPAVDEADRYITALKTVACSSHPLQTTQWTTVSAEADVPDAADSVVIGIVLTGNGSAWFGDLDFLEVVSPN